MFIAGPPLTPAPQQQKVDRLNALPFPLACGLVGYVGYEMKQESMSAASRPAALASTQGYTLPTLHEHCAL